jgi:putative transposase
MVRYRRNFVPGGSYFFTVTLADRTSSILVDHVDALRTAFRVTRHERPFTIDAIVILPEHLHTIWTLPSGDSDFSGRWKRIKAYFTHRIVARSVPVKRHRNGEYALWHRRFWEHTIRNETDFERHVDYVHFNPVKHKLVSRVRDWPYSSFHAYVRRGRLPLDWAGDVDDPMMDFGERKG